MRPAPFPNPSNICYFNALLQCVLLVTNRHLIIPANCRVPINLHMLSKMVARLEKKGIQYMAFQGDQCAAETYSAMLEAYSEFPRFVSRFASELTTTRTCIGCGVRSVSAETTTIWHLPNAPELQLNTEEVIDFRCSCGRGKSIRRTELTNLAPILVLQVKRTTEANLVPFPDELAGRRRVASVHHCNGHYAACVLYDEWWVADDATVFPGVLSDTSAYMVFYAEGAPPPPHLPQRALSEVVARQR